MLVFLLVLFCQDPQINKLIDELGDDAFTVRDCATKALIKIGAPALEALKAAESSKDAETRSRATAIVAEIERNIKLAKFFKPYPSLKLTQAIQSADLRTEFKRQTGIEITGNALSGKKFDVAWNDTTFMQALDDIGAQVDSTWELSDGVHFTGRNFVKRPTVYSEGFKIYIARTDSYRSWDGNTGNALGWIYLNVKVDKGVQCKPPTIVLTEITDGGKVLTVDKNEFPTGTQQADRLLFMAEPISIHQLPTTTRTISIKGRIACVFPIAVKEVELPGNSNTPVQIEGFTVSPVNVGSSNLGIMVTRPGELSGVANFIDFDSVVVEDTDGNKPKLNTGYSGYAPDSGSLNIQFPEIEHPTIKNIKFKLYTEFVIKEIPFNFPKVELP